MSHTGRHEQPIGRVHVVPAARNFNHAIVGTLRRAGRRDRGVAPAVIRNQLAAAADENGLRFGSSALIALVPFFRQGDV